MIMVVDGIEAATPPVGLTMYAQAQVRTDVMIFFLLIDFLVRYVLYSQLYILLSLFCAFTKGACTKSTCHIFVTVHIRIVAHYFTQMHIYK